ncbi:MAG TPA: C1 family peptidase [Patescibacteria group bacterium]
MTHHYGYIPDLPDHRDKKFAIAERLTLPTSVDLRDLCPPVEDQGQLGSCTSFAGGAAIRVARKIQGLADFTTSHLFLYYNSRSKNTKSVDAGATIRDTIKSAAKIGDCPELEWPYDLNQFTTKPPQSCYNDALKDRAIVYQRVMQNIMQMKTVLALGYPFVIGFSVYTSFESAQVAQDGIVPMPGPDEAVLGGHAVLCVGYDDSQQRFLFRNSWGTGWGIDGTGYFSMSYAYLQDSNLASDFWMVKTVSV